MKVTVHHQKMVKSARGASSIEVQLRGATHSVYQQTAQDLATEPECFGQLNCHSLPPDSLVPGLAASELIAMVGNSLNDTHRNSSLELTQFRWFVALQCFKIETSEGLRASKSF